MKPFWQSKTLWFNALFLIVSLAGVVGFGEFQPSPEIVEVATVVAAVINLVLRLVTKQAVTR
jgi:hypothetical protein